MRRSAASQAGEARLTRPDEATGRRMRRPSARLTASGALCRIAEQALETIRSKLPQGAFMNIASRGATMAVDWEQRVDFDRLRRTRLAKTKADARRVGARGAAALRSQQPPLRHEHRDRDVGARQEHPLRARVPRRGPGALGLRLGGPPPQALLPVAPGGRAGARGCRRCAARCRTRRVSRTRWPRWCSRSSASAGSPRSPSVWTCPT